MPAAPAELTAAPAERAALVERFVALCEIESPSGCERPVADAVTSALGAVGLSVAEDESAAETGSDCGNLLARIPPPAGAATVLLCAHMDTVPLTAPIEVEDRDGMLSNHNDGILGADNKAAVAVLLALAERLARDGSPVGLELLFTTGEELALEGAKAFDRSTLRADFGYVFDHASPIGEIVVAAPTYYRLEARLHGRAAHAGVRPEEGRNAIAAAAAAIERIEVGRLDVETTSNVGMINGGTAANVVAERCTVELEARSLDHERAGSVVGEMVDAFTAAGADRECDVETVVEQLFRGYRLAPGSPPVALAALALESRGITPSMIATGGGSDANVFCRAGLPCVNLANGTERNHQPDERVSRQALETMLDVALALVAAAGEGPTA